MAKQDKVKLAFAIVVLLLAGGILAWYYGLFDSAPTPASVAPPPGPATEPPAPNNPGSAPTSG